jgi:hypothetical protein
MRCLPVENCKMCGQRQDIGYPGAHHACDVSQPATPTTPTSQTCSGAGPAPPAMTGV